MLNFIAIDLQLCKIFKITRVSFFGHIVHTSDLLNMQNFQLYWNGDIIICVIFRCVCKWFKLQCCVWSERHSCSTAWGMMTIRDTGTLRMLWILKKQCSALHNILSPVWTHLLGGITQHYFVTVAELYHLFSANHAKWLKTRQKCTLPVIAGAT